MDAQTDLLIRGGILVDGTGSPRRRADVRSRDGLIVEVGPDLRPDGEREVDAGGAFVAPGFIDGHTHFDPSLFWDPACDPMPQHGVTTILFGNCSLSLAPVRAKDREEVSTTFGVIEEIPAIGFSEHVPWDWESYPEYIQSMRSRGFGVNVAGLVGLSMLRLYVLGDEAWERASTAEEREQIVALLDEALLRGASGFSTSFYDRGADGRLVPSALADDAELKALISVTGIRRGHFEILGSVFDRALLKKELERCARWCAAANATLTWNGFLDWDKDPSVSQEDLELAQRLQRQGMSAYPTISPHPHEFMANWQGGMGFLHVPAWNELLQAESEAVQRQLLSDLEWRSRAVADWDSVESTTFPHRNLDLVMIDAVEHPDLEQFVGRSFGEWARSRGGHPSDALADWLEMNDLHPMLTYTVGNNNHDRVGALLGDPATVVSASDAGAHCTSHCNSGDTTLLLTRYVRDRGDLTLEEATFEITGRLADVYGFTDRGRVQEGKAADLTVFDLDALTWSKPQGVDDFPGNARRYRRPAGGYRFTVAGGVITQEDGTLTRDLPGAWLDGRAPA